MSKCLDCIFFVMEDREVDPPGITQSSFISYAGTIEENPPEVSYRFTVCQNEETATDDLTRSELTDWFFGTTKYTDLFIGSIVVSEEDMCTNFVLK